MTTHDFLRAAHAALIATLALSAAPVLAAGAHSGGHMTKAIGEPGDPAKASRTIRIEMHDNYYKPEKISVAKGETVRFEIVNKGNFVHEFNIGTGAMHEAHQEEMTMMVEHGIIDGSGRINRDRMKMDMGGGKTMEHDDPNSVLVETGGKVEIVWRFAEATDLEFACNLPGHYASGMVGDIRFR
ncbi:MAG: cupredoxin domain-containing protein [Acetobacterales bacterium]